MRSLPWILGGLAVLSIAAVLILLDDDAAETDARPMTSPSLGEATGIPGGAFADAARPSERMAVSLPTVAVDAAVEEPEDGMPESYRRALGGIVGRVIEEDGTPVANLLVELVGAGVVNFTPDLGSVLAGDGAPIDLVLGEGTTGADGRFRIDDVEPRTIGALVLDSGGPRARLHLLEESPQTGTTRDVGDIVIAAGVTLTGVVIDEREEPVAGARVRVTDLPSMVLGSGVADFRQGGGVLVEMDDEDDVADFVFIPPPSLARLESRLPIPTTHTDADGRFTFEGVRPGLLSVVVDDGVHLTLVHGPVPTGDPGGSRDLGTLMIGDGVTLTGRVVDTRGDPVPDVQVMGGNNSMFGQVTILRPPVTADADGRFAITGLKPTVARAAARADEVQPFAASEAVSAGAMDAVVVLPAPSRLTLEIVDPDGTPVAGATLLGAPAPDTDLNPMVDFVITPRRLDERVEVDEEGAYVLEGMQPALWELIIDAPGFGVAREVVILGYDELRHRVTLEPERTLSVTALRDVDDTPVEWALVTARAADGGFEDQLASARTDGRGVALLRNLHEGDFAIEVDHPALAVTMALATIPSEEDLVIRLAVGGTIAGTITDNGAPPALPLLITLSRDDGDELPGAAIPRLTLSDLDGRFSFTNIEPGTVDIEARDRIEMSSLSNWWEPFAMTPLAEDEVIIASGQETEVYLVVGSTYEDLETGFVQGRLMVNGYPEGDWKVRTWGQIRRSVTTEDDGSFDMGRLAAGDVVLMFSPEGSSMMDGGIIETHQLKLEPNATEYVEIAVETGSIEGRVVSDLDGRPIEGAAVTAQNADSSSGWWGGRRGATGTMRDGSFRIDMVGTGRYTLTAQADGYANVSTEAFEVTPLSTSRNHELRLVLPVTAKGKIVLAGVEEQPDWMWLTAESERGNEAAARVNKSTGAYEMDDLAPGTWTFTVYTGLDTEFETLTVQILTPQENLVLTFQPVEPEPELTEEEQEQLEALGYVGEG